jgi:hypothetical protein
MTTLAQLQATRDLITDEEHFTTSARARDENGAVCEPRSLEARSWCITGAWLSVSGSVDDQENYQALRKLCGYRNIFGINDILGHDAGLGMLDQAITRLTP